MSWRTCSVSGCTNRIREGLRRFGAGVDGQELADGRTCWRCRARQAERPIKKTIATDVKRCKAKGHGGGCELAHGHVGEHINRKQHGSWSSFERWHKTGGGGHKRCAAFLRGGAPPPLLVSCDRFCPNGRPHKGPHRGLSATQRGRVVEWAGVGARGWIHLPIGDAAKQIDADTTTKAKDMTKAKSVAGNFDEIWDNLAGEGACDDRPGVQYGRIRAEWNKKGGDIATFIRRRANASVEELEKEPIEIDDDRMDGTDCGVRDGKKGASCIQTQGHLGPHSNGKRTWANKPAKASRSMKAMEAAQEPKPEPIKHPNERKFGYRRHAAGALWPIIEGEEFAELVSSVKGRGLDDDIVLVKVDGEEFILDGWNRARACQEAKVKPKFTKYIGQTDIGALLDYVDMKNARRRHISAGTRAAIAVKAAKLRRGALGRPGKSGTGSALPTQKQIAASKGISARYLRTAAMVEERGTPELFDAVLKGKINPKAAAAALGLSATQQNKLASEAIAGDEEMKSGRVRSLVKQEEKRAVVARINKEQVTPMPVGPFRVIRVDNPWPFENADQHEGSRGHMPYPAMTIAAICQLRPELDKLVHEEGCILAMDVPNAFIHEVGRVLEAWAFTHRTMITWDKGSPGIGTWCRGQTEHLVIASRGIPVHTLNEVTTLLKAKRREHSRKPDELADLLLKHCPGPHVELFAREPREGWASWGAEPNKFEAKGAA